MFNTNSTYIHYTESDAAADMFEGLVHAIFWGMVWVFIMAPLWLIAEVIDCDRNHLPAALRGDAALYTALVVVTAEVAACCVLL